MRPFRLDIDVADADADGLADNNDSSGATLTLDGALTSGGTFTSADGLAHRLSITDTATSNQSGATFTVTGTDADGRTQSEAITGPGSGATVESTKYFLTVTGVSIASGVGSATVDMGTVDEVATATIPLDIRADLAPTVQLDVTGTISVDIQVTCHPLDQSLSAPFDFTDQEDLPWVNDANFGAKTADTLAQLALPGYTAMRVVTNSYTNGAEAQVFVNQAGGNS